MFSNVSRIELTTDFYWKLILVMAATALIITSSDAAFASASESGNDIIGNTLCKLVNNLTGNIARAIATIAIFVVGAGLFVGKANWSVAATTAVGVGIIFGAGKLVSWIAPDNAGGDCAAVEG